MFRKFVATISILAATFLCSAEDNPILKRTQTWFYENAFYTNIEGHTYIVYIAHKTSHIIHSNKCICVKRKRTQEEYYLKEIQKRIDSLK